MRDRLADLESAGLPARSIAVVTFAPQAALAPHRAHLDLPFPLLSDPERVLYRRFGLERGSLRQVYSPGTLRMYGRLLRQGRRMKRPTEDTRQLGGDFVIDARGRLAAGFWPASPDQRPSVDDLVAAVRALEE